MQHNFVAIGVGMTAIEAGQAAMQGDIAVLQAGQVRIEAGQIRIEAGQVAMQGDIVAMQAELAAMGRVLHARLPPLGQVGQCQSMRIVAAQTQNTRSVIWVPVPNSAGNPPNPPIRSRAAVNRMNVAGLNAALRHYGVVPTGSKAEKQQRLLELLTKG